MPLPTKLKTYNYHVNNVCTEATAEETAEHAVWQLKESLISFSQWSGVASCDSTAVKNIGDGGDLDLWDDWASDIVHGSGAHSWIVLENSVTGEQLCIDCLATWPYLDVVYSATGSFAADGTTSSRPTDTESVYIIDGKQYVPTSVDGVVVNAMCSTDGKITRAWMYMIDGSTKGSFFFGLEEPIGVPTQWNASIPRALLCIDSATGLSAVPTAQSPKLSDIDGTSEKVPMYLTDSTPYEGWNYAYLTTECYHQWTGDQGNACYEPNVNMDWNEGFPMTALGMFRTTSPRQGGMGAFQDVYAGPEQHQSITTYPNDSTYLWIKIGGLVLPWNGSVPVESP